MKVKNKLCANEGCNNSFSPFKTTDKYCSYGCAYNNHKPKKAEKSKFELDFEIQSAKIKRRLLKKHGKLICERCKIDKTIQFSTHHIIFRSEKPKHPALNTQDNLIHLCYDCHEWFHKSKTNRNYLVEKRNLCFLFGSIWGVDN